MWLTLGRTGQGLRSVPEGLTKGLGAYRKGKQREELRVCTAGHGGDPGQPRVWVGVITGLVL